MAARSYLYVERSFQEVLISGDKDVLEKLRKHSLGMLRANRVACLSKEHFYSLQKAWKRDTEEQIHSAVGETIIIPKLDAKSGETSIQLFLDLTKLSILHDKNHKPKEAVEDLDKVPEVPRA
ncbi:MAG: hypothetical protein R3A13_02375 [Bdellovibrionota bacterium]